MWRNHSLTIFLTALVLRLIYIAQIRDAPYFDVPLVDGANYVRTAALIAGGDLLAGPQVFWQPPLYPYFLAVLMGLFGLGLGSIYIVQALIGAFSCWLVHRIGRRLFGEREASWAAVVMACYGPLIFFDAQPLIPVLHIALILTGLLFLLRAAGIGVPGTAGGRMPEWGLAGLAWGLSAVATPNILLAVPVAVCWSLLRERNAGRPRWGGAWACAALFLAGVALPVAAVAARNLVVAGEPVLISSNGGINFYLGNNPDYDQTIRIRPGGEFERLAQQPENLGIVGAAARSRYFTRRAVDFLAGYPRAALRLYGRKVRDLLAGREIPRNQDSYVYREYSSLLAALQWRFGPSFPFGIVAPLALGGALLGARAAERSGGRRPSGSALLLWYAAAYGFSIMLFFPTARYRLPLIPVAALFAGRLLGACPSHAWGRGAFCGGPDGPCSGGRSAAPGMRAEAPPRAQAGQRSAQRTQSRWMASHSTGTPAAAPQPSHSQRSNSRVIGFQPSFTRLSFFRRCSLARRLRPGVATSSTHTGSILKVTAWRRCRSCSRRLLSASIASALLRRRSGASRPRTRLFPSSAPRAA